MGAGVGVVAGVYPRHPSRTARSHRRAASGIANDRPFEGLVSRSRRCERTRCERRSRFLASRSRHVVMVIGALISASTRHLGHAGVAGPKTSGRRYWGGQNDQDPEIPIPGPAAPITMEEANRLAPAATIAFVVVTSTPGPTSTSRATGLSTIGIRGRNAIGRRSKAARSIPVVPSPTSRMREQPRRSRERQARREPVWGADPMTDASGLVGGPYEASACTTPAPSLRRSPIAPKS